MMRQQKQQKQRMQQEGELTDLDAVTEAELDQVAGRGWEVTILTLINPFGCLGIFGA
jgi:hypothetical protein